MKLKQPIIFEPLFMERVWGGRRLEVLFNKKLPAGARIGESWELVDRPEAQSVVHSGPLRGKTLHELWTEFREAVFGAQLVSAAARFPLLIKLLDAEERLSLQVHPPAEVAAVLKGEPKTEMWYLADARADSAVFAGLKAGVTRGDFEQSLQDGTAADLVHRIPVRTGDALFIPSGRLHAIGAGSVLVEVQQNSDTTYRVFDWNRPGMDGQPRQLHVNESLESINFDDTEPAAVEKNGEVLVHSELFRVEKWDLDQPRQAQIAGDFAIFTCLAGAVECAGKKFLPGDFFLVAAELEERELTPAAADTAILRITIPAGESTTAGPSTPN